MASELRAAFLTLRARGATLGSVRPLQPSLFVFLVPLVACASAQHDEELRTLNRAVAALQQHSALSEERLVDLGNQMFVLSDRLEGMQTVEAARVPAPTLEVVKLVPPEERGARRRGKGAQAVPVSVPYEDESIDVDLTGYDEPGALPVVDVPPPPPDRRDPSHALAERLFQAALSAYREGRADEALKAFGDLVTKFPTHRYADSAWYWMGEARFEAKAFGEAAAAFSSLLAKHPRSGKVPEALYKLGVSCERLGQAPRARQAFTDLVGNFPHNALAELARARLQNPSSEGGTR
jgi:tol-pal system protein YbgF